MDDFTIKHININVSDLIFILLFWINFDHVLQ